LNQVREKKFEEKIKSRNPNFGEIMLIEGLQLPQETLLWPLLHIEIRDEGLALGMGGCETCYATISLMEFADQILEEEDIDYAKAQMYRN